MMYNLMMKMQAQEIGDNYLIRKRFSLAWLQIDFPRRRDKMGFEAYNFHGLSQKYFYLVVQELRLYNRIQIYIGITTFQFLIFPDAPFGANNCSLLGTKNGLKREGNATVLLTDNTARFTSKFRMEDLGLYCDFKVLWNDVLCNYSSGISWLLERGQHPWLTEFLVTDIDEIVVNVDGFFGLNWLIEDIADWIANGAEDYIVKVVETDVKYVFQAVLDTIVIP
ncbi:hypothetical protein Anas_12092 [Armadillidium nasatum]|uniref:Uncharacterized protein n=1 Tax=Armadillidium nasatum TaxID=96803 RepID=A0A5N5SKF9_9CRUS|nr:hypothetical protein Anas_12092 [Armadillidium nasatum]